MRRLLLIGGFLIVLGLSVTTIIGWPKTFNLIKSAYRTVEDWAIDRGEQIRRAFGIKLDSLRPEGTISPIGISTNDWNETKIGTLHPAVRDRFRQFTSAAQRIARTNGEELMIWEASRGLERQLELFKRGRTASGKVVTYTIASNHLFGNAADYIVRRKDGQPDFDKGHPRWYRDQVLPLASQYGLESLWLSKGFDLAHIQLKDNPSSVSVAQASLKSDFPGIVT